VSDAIVVKGIRAEGRHGLEALNERDEPQPWIVDVEFRLELHGIADELSATVDYTEIAKAARGVIEKESFELVETLANAIAARLLEFGADSVRVKLYKPRSAALVGVDEIAVTVERLSD
jgi:dihydroneopterin aldolase